MIGKKIFFILLAFIAFSGLNAATDTEFKYPTDANIIGHVKDSKTGEHLVGITIAIKGTTFGTSTDATGHYYLRNLRPGEITLIMRGMGYKSQERVVRVEKDLQSLNFAESLNLIY